MYDSNNKIKKKYAVEGADRVMRLRTHCAKIKTH